ncbi:MAG: hypothetical protein E7537_04620 [Ruminococcaceae bacterium]|nr:hypothetical protein [Oscillospiraceae bacterium]
MNNFFENHRIEIGEKLTTPFVNSNNIYQDGTTPMYRDTDGKLWAMSGHTHVGEIAMFCGNSLDDIKKLYPIKTNFKTGNAEYAFFGICYPEGIKPRGSIWPFGLYICPNTHRFFCWFHNETGWAGDGSAYDAFGPCEEPKYDSDFRHIGLMHSDDEGKTWDFDRWVMTGFEPSLTSRYNPNNDCMIGQAGDVLKFGCGDFSIFVEPEGDYIYLFYSKATIDISAKTTENSWQKCEGFVARCLKRTDGTMGDFVKYYDGAFCEAGNLGRESAILADCWHPRVVYSQPLDLYIMVSKPMMAAKCGKIKGLDQKRKVAQFCVSKDLVNWSCPKVFPNGDKPFGNHYNAIVSDDGDCQPHILKTNEFSILCNHNGTDVERFKAKII